MTEEELIELGFKRIDVLDEESQNGYDYYYYSYDKIPGITFLSCANDEAIAQKWIVYIEQIDTVKIPTKDLFLDFHGFCLKTINGW
jgi:hypothetical protein